MPGPSRSSRGGRSRRPRGPPRRRARHALERLARGRTTSSESPGARRSSASFVRTQVSGHGTPLRSSRSTAAGRRTASTRSARPSRADHHDPLAGALRRARRPRSAAHSAAPPEMPASTPSRRAAAARGLDRVLVVDRHDLVDHLAVEHLAGRSRRRCPGSCAGRAARPTAPASRRLDRDHLQVRVALLEDARRAGDRAAGADAGHEHVDLAVEVAPRSPRPVVRRCDLRVGRVRELVGQPRVGARRRERRAAATASFMPPIDSVISTCAP